MTLVRRRPTLEIEAVGAASGGAAEAVRLFDGGAEAFPRMLEVIGEAQRRVHLEIYTFAWDDVGRRFVSALSETAARGVHVRVIIDGWGSLMSGATVAEVLRGAGCEVTIFHPVSAFLLGGLRRNHRKLLLIDDRIAIVGGINIADDYETRAQTLGWADLAVEVTGPAVEALAARLHPRDTRSGSLPPEETGRTAVAAGGHVRIYLSGIGGGHRLRKRYLKAFASATRELVVAHAYFLPDTRLARTLRAAAKRGVKVTLLLAGRSDVPFARAATLRLYRAFLASGVRIHEWHHSVLHAKAALVDGHRFLVGSFNLDPLSLTNLEALVEVDDPRTAEQAQRWMNEKIAHAREVRIEDCARGFFQRWIGDAVGLFFARAVEWLARVLAVRRPPPFGEAGEGAGFPKLGVRRPRLPPSGGASGGALG